MPGKEASKAYVAGAIAFLTSLTTVWTATDVFRVYYVVVSLAPALAAFAGVYWTPNTEE